MKNYILTDIAREAISNSTGSERKARLMIQAKSTAELLTLWDLTEAAVMTEELPTVRGWVMDELQVRFPAEMDRWLDTFDDPLRDYIPA